ncbi:hypothetical protein JCM24511_07793 [Saitozyma sp. JCM 24511]|nr:hypothetical protein JCM24511_07793 [Saitozyma sp. JCM 24511]
MSSRVVARMWFAVPTGIQAIEPCGLSIGWMRHGTHRVRDIAGTSGPNGEDVSTGLRAVCGGQGKSQEDEGEGEGAWEL